MLAHPTLNRMTARAGLGRISTLDGQFVPMPPLRSASFTAPSDLAGGVNTLHPAMARSESDLPAVIR
jgi:hypothetical protein